MKRVFPALAFLGLIGCSGQTALTGQPLRDAATFIGNDAVTAGTIAVAVGIPPDAQCFADIHAVMENIGLANSTVGALTLIEIKRAMAASNSGPCAAIWLDVLMQLVQLGLKFAL